MELKQGDTLTVKIYSIRIPSSFENVSRTQTLKAVPIPCWLYSLPRPGQAQIPFATVMECQALKVNRAISMIVWVNSVKNMNVAGAMKRHLTPEAGFCYQSKQTTVPPPLSSRMTVRGVSDLTSLNVLEEPSKRFIGFGRPRNYDFWNLKARVCRLLLFATKTPSTYLLAQPTSSGIWKFCVAVT